MENKLLARYNSVSDIENLRNKIVARQRRVSFGNKISISQVRILQAINEVLTCKENFLTCDICGYEYTPFAITENFDEDLSVCDNCQENYYSYCNDCGIPIYKEGQGVFMLNEDIYCESCYFKLKDEIIENYNITDKKLKSVTRYLQAKKLTVDYDNLKNFDFKIKGYNFSIESYSGGYRLGSWGANFWADLTKNESDLLKAIQCIIDKNGYKIQDVKL
jgi:hypothetical protein